MNLYMTPYGCMSTGFEVGMIEVVPHSVTVARVSSTNIDNTWLVDLLIVCTFTDSKGLWWFTGSF